MGSNDGNLLKVSKLKNVAKGFFFYLQTFTQKQRLTFCNTTCSTCMVNRKDKKSGLTYGSSRSGSGSKKPTLYFS